MGTLLKMCYFKTSCILIISAIKHLCVQQREREKKIIQHVNNHCCSFLPFLLMMTCHSSTKE